jgi:Flp pilus assembly protein TadG
MLRNTSRSERVRRGATMVENAFVLSIFLMMIFGIFEWGRYIFMVQLTQNAARDAARYAAVRVNQSDNIVVNSTDTTTFNGRPAYVITEFTNAATARMAGFHNTLENFQVLVYPCDPAGMYASTVVIQPKPAPSTWNNATFSERIAIQIDCQFRVLLPNLLRMPNTLNIRCISLVSSEG